MNRGSKIFLKTTKPSSREGFSYIGAAGFEPTTPTTPKWYATKLRYAPFLQLIILTLNCANNVKSSPDKLFALIILDCILFFLNLKIVSSSF
jgi:hypothetical protein